MTVSGARAVHAIAAGRAGAARELPRNHRAPARLGTALCPGRDISSKMRHAVYHR